MERSEYESNVRALAALDRRTTRPGERASAELLAAKLREAGAVDVERQSFTGPSTWAWTQAGHAVGGLVACAIGGRAGGLLALATLASYEADVSGRRQWLGRLVAPARGTTVQGRIPSRGPRRRTVVFAGHHDAAHGGWVWHPRAVAANRRRLARTGKALPSHLLPCLGIAAGASGVRALRIAGGALLGLGLGVYAQAARSPTTPGANDNATGAAALVELARRFAADPLPGTEVVLLSPGGEEAGTTGMYAWTRGEGRRHDRSTTLVVGLDSLGSPGELVTSRREGFTGFFSRRELDLVREAAERCGADPPREVVFFNPTDACTARRAGFPAVSLLTIADGWIPNLHLPTDTPDRVSWEMAAEAIRVAGQLAVDYARPRRTHVDPG